MTWRGRYAESGLAGLEDLPRPGKPAQLPEALRDRVLELTLTEPPDRFGATHWSSRLLASALAGEGTPISHATVARIWHRFGVRRGGRRRSSSRVLSALLVLIGLGGPMVMPPVTAVLLNSVHGHRAGTASGVFNTSRQVGGALAIAVFGGLLAHHASFMRGLRDSLLIAAVVVLLAAVAAVRLRAADAREVR